MSSSRRSRNRRTRQILANLMIVLLAIVTLVLLVGLFLPRSYRVERSIEVNAKPEVIYRDLSDLRQWPEWTAWNKEMDPTADFQFTGDPGMGASYRWTGAKLGRGELKLTEANPTNGIAYEMRMDRGDMTTEGVISLVPRGNATEVTWVDQGDLGRSPVNRYVGLFIDSMLGPEFEKGLAKLKSRAEAVR